MGGAAGSDHEARKDGYGGPPGSPEGPAASTGYTLEASPVILEPGREGESGDEMKKARHGNVASKPRSKIAWTGYAACALALLHAAVSFYWASGGTAGLSTLGGQLEAMGRASSPTLTALVWGVGALKVLAGLLALALVMPWGPMSLRWMVLAAGWGGATLLTMYGGVLVVVEALVVGGIVVPSGPVDWRALRWHLFLWDPWFLLWGVLLGVAAWHYTRSRTNSTR